MVYALVDGVADQVVRHRIIRRAVDAGERHAAEADGGDCEPARAERAMREVRGEGHGCVSAGYRMASTRVGVSRKGGR